MCMKNNNEDKEIRDWRNEHGEPDFDYLQSLAHDDSVEALEKLQSIATDLDVEYNSSATAEELVEIINMAAQENEDGNDNVTS